MLHTKTAWLRVTAPVAVLALALTACGDKKDTSAAQDGKKSNAGAGAPKTDKTSDPAGGGARKPGQAGTGRFKEESGNITYEVVAQKVHVGTEAETKKLVSDPKDAKGLVAATAWVKFTNKGGGVVKELPKVGNETELYGDGRPGALLIGAAEDGPGCEDTIDIENWKAGQSHTICQTYMLPKGTKSVEVHWAGEGQSASPFIWRFSSAD
ncbi:MULTISPECIES: hypothetical protein [Streptomyces]|uniref:Lipoprotein n=1 Tax=Streptomyces siderophoricus TaxID=2802281 RepID=A0ABS1MVS0_9ACTN|nr:hypothetical protein [Streptomyces sp. 9-7]MBL1091859.1 hypothetical protein [Streptomyces sp. 9-7]